MTNSNRFEGEHNMNYRTVVWVFVALSLILLPAAITGCGSDDESTSILSKHYTIGPGSYDEFPASITTSIR